MNAATGHASGKNEDNVLSHAGYLRFNLRLGPVANGNHGDDRADPDDHPKHGEECAQQIPPQGAHRYLDGGQDSIHVVN